MVGFHPRVVAPPVTGLESVKVETVVFMLGGFESHDRV